MVFLTSSKVQSIQGSGLCVLSTELTCLGVSTLSRGQSRSGSFNQQRAVCICRLAHRKLMKPPNIYWVKVKSLSLQQRRIAQTYLYRYAALATSFVLEAKEAIFSRYFPVAEKLLELLVVGMIATICHTIPELLGSHLRDLQSSFFRPMVGTHMQPLSLCQKHGAS